MSTGSGTVYVDLPRRHAGAKAVLREYWRDDIDTVVAICGRKWRKTSNLFVVAQCRDLAEGNSYLHTAPTYDQVRECWNGMVRAGSDAFAFNESKMTITFPRTGAVGTYRSLQQPQNARSKNAAKLYVDEVQGVTQDVFEQVVLPISLNYDLKLLMAGTANGYDWVHDFARASEDAGKGAYYRIPTRGYRWDENGRIVHEPHPLENDQIPFERVARMAEVMTRSALDQEIGAKLVVAGGIPYPEFSRERNMEPAREIEYEPGLVNSVGIDFGLRSFAVTVRQYDKRTERVVTLYDQIYEDVTTEQAVVRMKSESPWGAWLDLPQTIIGVDPAGAARNTQTKIKDVRIVKAAFPQARVVYSTKPEHRSPEWRLARKRDQLLSADGKVRFLVHPRCKHTIAFLEKSSYPKPRPGHEEDESLVKDGVVDHMRDADGYADVALFHVERPRWLSERFW